MNIETNSASVVPQSDDRLMNLARSVGELAARVDVFTHQQLIPAVQTGALAMNPFATGKFVISPAFGAEARRIITDRMYKSSKPEGTQVVAPSDKSFPENRVPPPHVVVYQSTSSLPRAIHNFPKALELVYLNVESSRDFTL